MKPSIKEKIRQNHRLYVFLSISVCLLLILLGSALLAPLVVQTINDPQKFRDLVAQKGVWGYLLFILIQMLLVEQNAKKALSIADRAYVLETGSISLSGNAKDMLDNEKVKKAYLGE